MRVGELVTEVLTIILSIYVVTDETFERDVEKYPHEIHKAMVRVVSVDDIAKPIEVILSNLHTITYRDEIWISGSKGGCSSGMGCKASSSSSNTQVSGNGLMQ